MTPSRPVTAKRRMDKRKPSKPAARVCRVPHPGQKCAHCGRGKLEYDGLLQLSCPVCGFVASGGGFT